MEGSLLDLFDPLQRIFHAGKVVLRGICEQTVGVVAIRPLRSAHFIRVFELDIGETMQHFLLVQRLESAPEANCILTNANHRIVVLRVTNTADNHFREIVELAVLCPWKRLAHGV